MGVVETLSRLVDEKINSLYEQVDKMITSFVAQKSELSSLGDPITTIFRGGHDRPAR